MPVDLLRENDEIVRALQGALRDGGHGLRAVPPLVKRVIGESRWREREVATLHRCVPFADFAAFVTEHPPEGLGADLALLKRICADDPEALEAIKQATTLPEGGDRGNRYTVSDPSTVGNTNGARERNDAGYAIERLHRERPDLHAEVLAKRLSPHAAMIKAGFRAKRVALRTDNPDAVSAFLAKHFDAAEIMKIAELAVHIREGGE